MERLVASERFWIELRAGASVATASQAVGVSYFTGYRWLAEPVVTGLRCQDPGRRVLPTPDGRFADMPGRPGLCGGVIGLRRVAEHPDWFSAVVAANTGLPTDDHDMPQWWAFREAVELRRCWTSRDCCRPAAALSCPQLPGPATTRRSRTSRQRPAHGNADAGFDPPTTRRPMRTGRPRRCHRWHPVLLRVLQRRSDHRQDGVTAADHAGCRWTRPSDDHRCG